MDSSLFIDERGRLDKFFVGDAGVGNTVIIVSDPTSQKDTMVFAVNGLFDLHMVGAAAGAVGFPLKVISESGEPTFNITPWAVKSFRSHYQPGRGRKKRPINEEDIFNYVYAALMDPHYRKKYRHNLKEEFPRLPYYEDFWQWSDWGSTLLNLHTKPHDVEPYKLKLRTREDAGSKQSGVAPRLLLKSIKDKGIVRITTHKSLEGFPNSTWEYMLGSRSAVHWVLDQYKEKTPRHATISEKFNTYRFQDYEDDAIDLIKKVTTISVETVRIMGKMREAHNN